MRVESSFATATISGVTLLLGLIAGFLACATALMVLGWLEFGGALGNLFWVVITAALACVTWNRGRYLSRRFRSSMVWQPIGVGIAVLVAAWGLIVVATIGNPD